MVKVVGLGRIGNGSAPHDDRICRLGKKERRIARVIAHFLDVVFVVAADAIDAPHSKQPAARNRNAHRCMRFEQEISHA